MAEDIERPKCKCHGEPMMRNGKPRRGRTRREYVCAVRRRQKVREHHWHKGGKEQRLKRYYERKARGLCVRCGKPSLSESCCWDCLNRAEAHYALR